MQAMPMRQIGRVAIQSAQRARLALPRSSQVPPTRQFGMLVNYDEDLDNWPKAHTNTILNVCPQGQAMVVERLGKFSSIEEGGWFMAIPFIDKIRFVVDMREKALSIHPQPAITKDNVHVNVSGNLYCQFVDASKAAYGSNNPLYAVKQHAQSSMRAAIGEMELDEILHARAKLNAAIKSTVQESAFAWGLEIKRYEITEVTPDKFISEAMDKQAAAERDRRKKVLEAEGNKRAAELDSEGNKIRMKNESEGLLIKVGNEATAQRNMAILQAEGDARAIQIRAEAQAQAVRILAEALGSENGAEAARFALARDYIQMYGLMGQQSNTMIFSDKPADLHALLAQAGSILAQTKPNK